MSEWRDEKNRRALARLTKALPQIFPKPVMVHALARPFIPPMPRLAVDSYWRAHPIRADRLCRALAAKSGGPEGWAWRLTETPQGPRRGRKRLSRKAAQHDGRAETFRAPPAPYREREFARGPGTCCVCGQPVYRFGWHADLWDAGKSRASWHAVCVVAWGLWNAPTSHLALLKRSQKHRCVQSNKRLWKTAEVDHRMPLFRVWRDHRDAPWPTLLGYWGVPNLQVINRDVHVAKSVDELRARALANAAMALDVSADEAEAT
jgi:hypothetical protein